MDWETIEDNKVRHIWKCTDDECDCDHEEIEIWPSWYTDNGTPICDNGVDMVYQRTEINVE